MRLYRFSKGKRYLTSAQGVLYGRSFDCILRIPLIVYLVIIAGLITGVFIHASREAFLKAFRDEAILQSVKLSLITSLTSTFLSLLVAIPAGYLLSRYHFPGHAFLDTLLDLPIVLPPLVMGLALLIFFNTSLGSWLDRGIVKGGLFVYQPLGIILTQTIVGSAFATRVIKAGFDTFDKRYEEVAMALGANRWQTFVKVVIPSTIPSLVAGAVISWARIFGLFGPILLVCGTMRGHTEIMPTTIFLELSIGRLEVALIIGAVMVVLSTTTLIIFKRLGGKGYLW